MTPKELAEIEKRHPPGYKLFGRKWCYSCGVPWGQDGCDSFRLVMALREISAINFKTHFDTERELHAETKAKLAAVRERLRIADKALEMLTLNHEPRDILDYLDDAALAGQPTKEID